MGKTAASVSKKFVERASAASGDYVTGARETTKDQAELAIAGKANYAAGVQLAITQGRFEKGLRKSGKSGWLSGVEKKGGERFAGGVMEAAERYATESGRFDSARGAASSMARGPKGSQINISRVSTVVTALRAAKLA